MSPDERQPESEPKEGPPREPRRSPGRVVRLVLIGLAVLIALLLVLQNQEPVRTRFLGWGVEMPHFLLLLFVYLLGAATGWIAHWRSRR